MTVAALKQVGMIAVRWLPALMLAYVFGTQGFAKFSETSGWATAFRHWGYPDWFRIVIGVLEVAAAACMLYGRTAIVAALIIICVMIGAEATHVLKDGGRHMTSEVVPLVLSSLILFLRREQLRGLFTRSSSSSIR